MTRVSIAALVFLVTTGCAGLHADSDGSNEIDITTFTCEDFLAQDFITHQFSSPERHSIALLLTGYWMAEKDENKIAAGALLHMSDMLEQGCREGAFGDRPMLEAMLEDLDLK